MDDSKVNDGLKKRLDWESNEIIMVNCWLKKLFKDLWSMVNEDSLIWVGNWIVFDHGAKYCTQDMCSCSFRLEKLEVKVWFGFVMNGWEVTRRVMVLILNYFLIYVEL